MDNSDKINNKHSSVVRACSLGIVELKKSIIRYFDKEVKVKDMMDRLVDEVIKENNDRYLVLGDTNVNETNTRRIKEKMMEFKPTDYYLRQILSGFPFCIKFYKKCYYSLEKYRKSGIRHLYYTFYNYKSIVEINIDETKFDILKLCEDKRNILIKNTISGVPRFYDIKKTYILENETKTLYNVVKFQGDNYLVGYQLCGLHILDAPISNADEMEKGWNNSDCYLIPFYQSIKKKYDRYIWNGKCGMYKTSVYHIKDNVKLPTKMMTKLIEKSLVNDIMFKKESKGEVLYIYDFYITNDFVKQVKYYAEIPTYTDDELIGLFDITIKTKKSKSKTKTKIKKHAKEEEVYDIVKPSYIPIESNISRTSNSDDSDSDVDDVDVVDVVDDSLFHYDKIIKTYNNRYTFNNENDILKTNYYNNEKIYQLLNESDQIIFIKPLEKHYKTNYRYFNIMLKINNINTSQFHIHINNDNKIYSITMIKNLLD